MSLAAVLARISEIQALSAPAAEPAAAPASASAPAPAPAAPASAAGAGTFAPALAQASGASAGGLRGSGSHRYDSLIIAAARRHGIDPALVRAVVQHESGFNPDAGSSAGAQGLMQLMPSTAAGLGVTDPRDPAQSIEGGTKLLARLLAQYHGRAGLALAAYNAGPGAVAKYGGVPPYPETQAYVRNVTATWQKNR